MMVTKIFLLRVLLSFVVGGLYIGVMTRLSEKFGSKIGGLLIGLPSVALIGLIFIGLTQDQQALVNATTVMPATIAANSIFLVAFIRFYKFGWLKAYIGAISLWFGLNLPVVMANFGHIIPYIIISIFLFSISLTYFHKHPHRKVTGVRLTRLGFLFRIIFAGTFIALAVLLAKLLGPVWGGLFASFPAAFSATVIIFSRKHGVDFTASLSRSMAHGNLVNVVFVTAVFLLVPQLGVIGGIASGYLLCLLFAFISYKYIMRYL